MLEIEQKLVAVASIGLMLLASSALLYDRLLFAYAISLVYAVVRWKFAENGKILVSTVLVKWLLRCFIVISCILFAAGGGALGEYFKKYEFGAGISALIGFAFAYDIGRFLKKITLKGA